ncbi:uncharacterized protein LOC143914043 [Arctopsyche grandis]|uniref:uncharacterized protein LOC143914043 n=1 Tax=Arctopsyche grandis TaxID=121162 RepID=UPI00406D67F4
MPISIASRADYRSVRLNSKHNMVAGTRIYAQGTGFRVNFPVPKGTFHKRHRIHRRDVYQSLEELIMHHGYDGRACVLKSLCEASKVVTPQSNILLKLYKKIFTIPEGDDQNYPYLASEKCEELDTHCPISLLQLSRFTDDS